MSEWWQQKSGRRSEWPTTLDGEKFKKDQMMKIWRKKTHIMTCWRKMHDGIYQKRKHGRDVLMTRRNKNEIMINSKTGKKKEDFSLQRRANKS